MPQQQQQPRFSRSDIEPLLRSPAAALGYRRLLSHQRRVLGLVIHDNSVLSKGFSKMLDLTHGATLNLKGVKSVQTLAVPTSANDSGKAVMRKVLLLDDTVCSSVADCCVNDNSSSSSSKMAGEGEQQHGICSLVQLLTSPTRDTPQSALPTLSRFISELSAPLASKDADAAKRAAALRGLFLRCGAFIMSPRPQQQEQEEVGTPQQDQTEEEVLKYLDGATAANATAAATQQQQQQQQSGPLVGLCVCSVNVSHKCYSHVQALTALLEPMQPQSSPKDTITVPSGYEQVGHIAHLNLQHQQLLYKFLIGRVILDLNAPAVTVVVNKLETLSNEFRELTLEVLATASSITECGEEQEQQCCGGAASEGEQRLWEQLYLAEVESQSTKGTHELQLAATKKKSKKHHGDDATAVRSQEIYTLIYNQRQEQDQQHIVPKSVHLKGGKRLSIVDPITTATTAPTATNTSKIKSNKKPQHQQLLVPLYSWLDPSVVLREVMTESAKQQGKEREEEEEEAESKKPRKDNNAASSTKDEDSKMKQQTIIAEARRRIARSLLLTGEVKQHSTHFIVPYDKVYWNSRLSHEHERLVDCIGDSSSNPTTADCLFDCMAGIGPFVLPSAKLIQCPLIVGNDLNPACYEAMLVNARNNAISNNTSALSSRIDPSCWASTGYLLHSDLTDDTVSKLQQDANTSNNRRRNFVVSNLDGREFIRRVRRVFFTDIGSNTPALFSQITASHRQTQLASCSSSSLRLAAGGRPIAHFVLNLPAIAMDFLDAFATPEWLSECLEVQEGRVLVHVYTFINGLESAQVTSDAVEAVEGKLQCVLDRSKHVHASHHVRDVAPNKQMVCVSFFLPHVPRTEAAAAEGSGNIWHPQKEEGKEKGEGEINKEEQQQASKRPRACGGGQ